MKHKVGFIVLLTAVIFVAATALVICAVVFEPKPVHNSISVEVGSKTIPLEQFAKDGKEAGLITDISGISLDQPGEYTLQFSYKEKIYDSVLKIVDTTAPEGTPVERTIYNDEVCKPEDLVTDIRDVTQVAVSFGKTPDFKKIGNQTVTLHLTDTSGNVGVVEAKLTVIADTTFPVFSAMQELTVNLGQTVSYRKGITATDDRDGELSFKVDASGVNLEQEGTYSILYEATDSSGNTTKAERKLHVSAKLVVNQELVEEKARAVLDTIITDGMSAHEKITAIYFYVRRHVAYSHSPEKDLLTAAYDAIVKGRGDCFNYFSLAKVLLDLCEIDNLPVERYQGRSSHYWLLVNIGTGWYHYDPSPQSDEDPFRCFMKTDAQVKAYSQSRTDGKHDYYQFDESKYPDRATKKYKAP